MITLQLAAPEAYALVISRALSKHDTAQLAFKVWESGELDEALQQVLQHQIVTEWELHSHMVAVRVNAWHPDTPKKKAQYSVPPQLFVQGPEVWVPIILEDGMKWERKR